jgi:hypothetical protein
MRALGIALVTPALITLAFADRCAAENGCLIAEGFDGARSVFAADLDSDGDIDVLGAARYAGEIVWWENVTGGGSRWAAHVVEGGFPGATGVYAADLDSDGDPDIVGSSWDADEVAWWSNDGSGTRWERRSLDGGLDGAAAVFAADLDEDGDTDVLGVGTLADEVVWWENLHGDGRGWDRHLVNCNCCGASSIHVADLDSDGDPDLLTAAYKQNAVCWWENGEGWARHPVDEDFDQARCAFAADLDSDGDPDVLGAAAGGDEIAWWENSDGSGTSWDKRTIENGFDTTYAVHAADLDSDGDADVIGTSAMGNTVRWWENADGGGASWYAHTLTSSFGGAYAVHAADLDGDGTPDIVSAALGGDCVRWWSAGAVSLVSNTRLR